MPLHTAYGRYSRGYTQNTNTTVALAKETRCLIFDNDRFSCCYSASDESPVVLRAMPVFVYLQAVFGLMHKKFSRLAYEYQHQILQGFLANARRYLYVMHHLL